VAGLRPGLPQTGRKPAAKRASKVLKFRESIKPEPRKFLAKRAWIV
jgi:hypothetical protein